MAAMRPNYYGGSDNPYEVIKVIQEWGLGFTLGNVLKYICRAGKKTEDSLSDLKKAREYIDMEIRHLEKRGKSITITEEVVCDPVALDPLIWPKV
jgi:uncharacterized protein related to proFAR isomerase